MKAVTVYNCAIPQQYAFSNLRYRSMMLKYQIEIVTSMEGKPVDTEDCVSALKEGKADVASFPWLKRHVQELPEHDFRSRFLFIDPLSLLLPKNDLYLSFLRAIGVKEGRRLSVAQLRVLLSSVEYADNQKLLLREEASGTRQQVEQMLGRSVDDRRKLFNTPVDSKYDSTVNIYSEILSSAQLKEPKFLMGFVSKKIQLLANARFEDTKRILFLDLEGGEREFRVVCRRDGDQADADRVAILMAEMARRIETPATRRLSCPLWLTLVLITSTGALGFFVTKLSDFIMMIWSGIIVLLVIVSGIAGGLYLINQYKTRRK